MKTLTAILSLSLLIPTAAAADTTILTPTIRQGQTVVASFSQMPAAVTFDGKPVTVFPYGTDFRSVIPTSRTIALGSHALEVSFGSSITRHTIAITRGYSKTIVLPVPEKLNQTPTQVVQNLSASNSNTAKTTSMVSDKTYFTSPFGLPLKDNRRVSSYFGEVRQTGAERISHLGADFVMPKGSAVAAINSGVISQAYLDPIYGNTIILDHGRGIFSVYMHLNSMRVKAGQSVRKGQIIGTLGETGLASAPHLHLSIKINGLSVDPIQFVNAFK